jgi:hypothetical protein
VLPKNDIDFYFISFGKSSLLSHHITRKAKKGGKRNTPPPTPPPHKKKKNKNPTSIKKKPYERFKIFKNILTF